ncbi:50S ribosomal protein L18e [Sulfodiicoccus acidiphilus]|nr:50S ribosomal protein L18e [Sulfodiicoccus acidiphilus]
MVESGSTNVVLRKLIYELGKQHAPVWRKVAEELSVSSRRRVEVNVGKVNKLLPEGAVGVVPGKVLGAGKVDHPIVVVAFDFSRSAVSKIQSVGGRAIPLTRALSEVKDLKAVKVVK